MRRGATTMLRRSRRTMFRWLMSPRAVCRGPASRRAGDRAGQWESSETSDVDGKPRQAGAVDRLRRRPRTRATRSRPDQHGGQTATPSAACSTSSKPAMSFVRYEMRRRKQGSIDMTATFTFENARHYTGAATDGDVAVGGQRMTSNMAVDAKWIGAVQEIEPEAHQHELQIRSHRRRRRRPFGLARARLRQSRA